MSESESYTNVIRDTFVNLKNVSLNYGKVEALKGISVVIPPKKLVGLIGPDGVGKSSLLSLITGAHAMQEDKGEIIVLGGDIRDAKHRKKVCPKIAYMPQGLGKNLYFTLSVEENLQYFARLFGLNEKERIQRIDKLTRSTGLYPFLSRPAGKLSGGMKQKLGLCCALIHDPDLLVLDEPTTGVDPLARRQFWDLINHIRESQPQMGIIAATAYMDEAQRFDWLIAMDGGQILDTGTPKEILEKTHTNNLDAAFIQLMPEEKRSTHNELLVPPLEISDSEKENYAIEASNLTKKFGDFTAVDHVNFKIKRGEIFGFLGSNGCGKSTTMRMLTGLIPATEGEAKLFGKPIKENDEKVRLQLGYMTQAFSLYNELTVRQNLVLYARLYRIPEEKIETQVNAMLERFGLMNEQNTLPSSMPMGLKQRLSLAAAVIHKPQILILDEPTSGVDPIARDSFWEKIIELSRQDHVTIFVTTHFMNEAARCDRISLMHSGKSLACAPPNDLVTERGTETLEEAFISYLEEADSSANQVNELSFSDIDDDSKANKKPKSFLSSFFDINRCLTCSWKELLEVLRDPIRLTLAIFGALLLLFVIGYGLNLDVQGLNIAVLDWDHSELSVDYTLNIMGSKYFIEKPELHSQEELEYKLKNREIVVALEIPTDFGKKLDRGESPELIFWIDGSMPSRAETINGYVKSMHSLWLENYRKTRSKKQSGDFNVEYRYRYNPNFESLPAMVPICIPLLLMMIPAILSALSIVREKEMGSITNLYVTPVSRSEFLIGKQIPYVLLSLASAALLVLVSVFIFNVPITGGKIALLTALVLYCIISTGFGLLASSVTESQIAVIFLVMIGTMIPAIQFCGMTNPVTTLNGTARFIGAIYPTTYMNLIVRGIFNKALDFKELIYNFIILILMIPIIDAVSINLLKKQES